MSEAQAPAPKKSKKLLVIALAAVLLLGGGGGGAAWWFMQQKAAHAEGDEEEEAAPPPKKKKAEAKPLFSTLEPFTVNLKDPRGERFAQIGVTLQFEDPTIDAQVKERLPAIRNDILMLISSKAIEDLLTVEGKQRLAAEIRLAAGRALGVDLPDLDEDDEVVEVKPKADPAAGEQPAKPKKKKKKVRPPENPIVAVLFSQFIVQ